MPPRTKDNKHPLILTSFIGIWHKNFQQFLPTFTFARLRRDDEQIKSKIKTVREMFILFKRANSCSIMEHEANPYQCDKLSLQITFIYFLRQVWQDFYFTNQTCSKCYLYFNKAAFILKQATIQNNIFKI